MWRLHSPIYPFHSNVQNVTIPCHFQELLPFLGYTLYPASEDGPDRGFRNFGQYKPDAGGKTQILKQLKNTYLLSKYIHLRSFNSPSVELIYTSSLFFSVQDRILPT
jgi:hypothetical protein